MSICVIALVVSKLFQSSGGAYDGHYHYLGLIILPSTTRVFPGQDRECCYVSQVILTYHLVIICQSTALDYLIYLVEEMKFVYVYPICGIQFQFISCTDFLDPLSPRLSSGPGS